MYKLTVFVEDNEKTVILPQCLKIDRDEPHTFLKTATVYWDYNNVFTGYNDKITYHGNAVKFEGGYWTFSMIKDRLARRY